LVVAVTVLDDVPKPNSLQVHLHHQGPLGVVHPHQRGVDDAGGGRLLNDSLDDVFAVGTWVAHWR
jgi:hypothetical protein